MVLVGSLNGEVVVGADVLHRRHVEAEHAAVARRGEPGVMPPARARDASSHEFRARLDPFDRPAEPIGEGRNEHVLGIDALPSGRIRRRCRARGPARARATARATTRWRAEGIRALVAGPHGQAPPSASSAAHTARGSIAIEVTRPCREGPPRPRRPRRTPVDVADDLARRPTTLPGLHGLPAPRPHRRLRHRPRRAAPRTRPDQLGRVGGLVRIGSEHRRDRLADVADLAPGERPLRPRRVEANIGVGAVRA